MLNTERHKHPREKLYTCNGTPNSPGRGDCRSICAGSFVITPVHREDGPSVEELPPSDWPVSMSVGKFP